MFQKIIRHAILAEGVILVMSLFIVAIFRQDEKQSYVDAEQVMSQETMAGEWESPEEFTKEELDKATEEYSEPEEGEAKETTQSLETTEKKFIKWVDFNVCVEAMNDAYELDVESYESEVHLNWIELLAYLGTKYGGDFKQYKSKDLTTLADKLVNEKIPMKEITADMQYYSYYYEAYEAVLGGFVGEYEIEVTNSDATAGANGLENDKKTKDKKWEKKYGLKAFLPIAKNFPYNDYDDFGVARSYGYRRQHLGHDMMGQVGTPIIAVESGYVEALGWNQYGGWRIGIRSLDNKRYYYYAHLRQNYPYVKNLEVGSIVQAGDVIGYLGRTGYSTKENTNNIDTPHLHFGMQLIFDESQKEGNNEIWINCYNIVRFLYQNRSETTKNEETKEWYRIYNIVDPSVTEYKLKHGLKL